MLMNKADRWSAFFVGGDGIGCRADAESIQAGSLELTKLGQPLGEGLSPLHSKRSWGLQRGARTRRTGGPHLFVASDGVHFAPLPEASRSNPSR